MDFPTWVALGSYGGFACALLAAGSVSLLALRLRRGSRPQIARASLLSLIACALMLSPIWWLLRRFDVYGPTLGAQEVAFWLIWISLFGWVIPLLTTAFFFALASPEPAQAPQTRVSGFRVLIQPCPFDGVSRRQSQILRQEALCLLDVIGSSDVLQIDVHVSR